MKEKFENNPLLKQLKTLSLPANDFALFGSGPLFARGLREVMHDLDIIARGDAWEKAKEFGTPKTTKSGQGEVIMLFDENIEIFNTWGPGEWDINQLIDQADLIEGIKFVKLDQVLAWKKIMSREKDIIDIQKIEEFLARVSV